MRLPRSALALCVLVMPLITMAHAQTATPKSPWQDSTAANLDRDILRLSEVTGALAFLRELCSATDAAEWPQRMQQLLAAEGATPERKGRIAGAYNSGYRNYALTYRICTPSAQEAAKRFLSESGRLSGTILDRYGK